MRFSASGCRLVEYVDLGCFPDQRLENRWKIQMLVVRGVMKRRILVAVPIKGIVGE
jgi:hypothetical protein